MNRDSGIGTVGLAAPKTLTALELPGGYVAVCVNCGRGIKSDWTTKVWRHKGGFIRCPEPRKGWKPGAVL